MARSFGYFALFTIAQRRDFDAQDVDAVVEVATEAIVDELREIAVGGGEDPGVEGLVACASERAEAHDLERAKQLGLQVGRHFADLVEQDRASAGLCEVAPVVGVRPGKGAGQVTEELTFEQVVGYCRTVDGNEGSGRTPAFLVDRAGDQFLTDAGFTLEQHREIAAGELRDAPAELAHRR